jgi:hypothetical protein
MGYLDYGMGIDVAFGAESFEVNCVEKFGKRNF